MPNSAVWIDGELITDPTTHPTTRGGAESLAALFDRQHEYAGECLFPDPETGEPTNVSHMIPDHSRTFVAAMPAWLGCRKARWASWAARPTT